MKQSGPGAFDLGLGDLGDGAGDRTSDDDGDSGDHDEYAELAAKYGVEFDDDDDHDD